MELERELLKRTLNFILPDEYENDESLDYALLLYTQISDLLAQPEQKPVAWIDGGIGGGTAVGWYDKDIIDLPKGTKLYAHPPKREPIDDREISHGFRISKKAIHAESFWIGVKFAEKAHWIGVE